MAYLVPNQDVGSLKVPVNHATLMQVCHGAGNLPAQTKHLHVRLYVHLHVYVAATFRRECGRYFKMITMDDNHSQIHCSVQIICCISV